MTQLKTKNKIGIIIQLLFLIILSNQITVAFAQTPEIIVSPTPPIINADGETHQIIVIELQTANDQPYLAPRDTPIHLTTSNINIGTIDEFITIREGESYAKANFMTKQVSGITIITASSPGYVTGNEYLQVSQSNYEARLVVYASPSSQPMVAGENGKVVVQIIDNLGEPLITSEDIDVTLTSSNHTICTVIQDLIIEKGAYYATTEFTVTGSSTGESIISAQAQGYVPGSDVVTVFTVPDEPEQIALFFNPDLLLPDETSHNAVTIQLQDREGRPVAATTTTTIYISSSNTNLVTVDETVTINSGLYKTTAELTTYTENGESIISTSSPGMLSDSEVILIQGQIPTLVELYVVPEILVADESAHDIITVQLLDDEGNPVEARRDTEIFLTSTNADVGTVPSLVVIPQGNSYSVARFSSTEISGSTNILASMMGVKPSEKSMELVTQKFNMTMTAPNIIQINQTFTVQVELISSGLPLPGAQIEWTALGGVILSEETETNEDGIATVQIVQKFETLRLKAVSTKTGYDPVEAQKKYLDQFDGVSKPWSVLPTDEHLINNALAQLSKPQSPLL